MSNKKLDVKEIKDLLETEAQRLDLNVKGEIAQLKTPEQKQAEEEIQAWKSKKHHLTPLKEFKIPHELINVILETDQYNGLIFYGEGGIGKTVLTITSIKNALNPEDWEYSNGYTTPLKLYQFLYSNRKKKAIILDDTEGIFNNAISLSILKGSLWDSDGKRIVQYSSTSERVKIPPNFIMKAKIIILCNTIPKEEHPSTRAMISRTIPYEIRFSFEQKIRICKTFIKKDKTLSEKAKAEIVSLLEKNVSEATKDFNFRTLKKLMAFVQYDREKAEELFRATTQIDSMKEAYFRALKQTNVGKAQIELFRAWTGKSRSYFFRLKRELKKCQGVKFSSMVDTKK